MMRLAIVQVLLFVAPSELVNVSRNATSDVGLTTTDVGAIVELLVGTSEWFVLKALTAVRITAIFITIDPAIVHSLQVPRDRVLHLRTILFGRGFNPGQEFLGHLTLLLSLAAEVSQRLGVHMRWPAEH